jgi:tetratricopeptide (TPR) repeat protein
MFPAVQSVAYAALGLVYLARQRPAEGLALIERSPDAGSPANRSTRYLARAELLRALGRTADAEAAIREARERILRIAGSLHDPEVRQTYKANVGVNARTLALAETWLGPERSVP